MFWLTKTSAMVALHRKENALPAMKALTKQETNGNNYKVLSYMQYRSTKKELDHKTIIEVCQYITINSILKAYRQICDFRCRKPSPKWILICYRKMKLRCVCPERGVYHPSSYLFQCFFLLLLSCIVLILFRSFNVFLICKVFAFVYACFIVVILLILNIYFFIYLCLVKGKCF